LDSDEATAIDAVTNQSTTASVMTENHDSEDVHSFDSIVTSGFGNLSFENTQTNEDEDDSRGDISNRSSDDTLRNPAAESNFTQTDVRSNASMIVRVKVRKSHKAKVLLTST